MGSCYEPLPGRLQPLFKAVQQCKWRLFQQRQRLDQSHKEVCSPVIEKCRFLLYQVGRTTSTSVVVLLSEISVFSLVSWDESEKNVDMNPCQPGKTWWQLLRRRWILNGKTKWWIWFGFGHTVSTVLTRNGRFRWISRFNRRAAPAGGRPGASRVASGAPWPRTWAGGAATPPQRRPTPSRRRRRRRRRSTLSWRPTSYTLSATTNWPTWRCCAAPSAARRGAPTSVSPATARESLCRPVFAPRSSRFISTDLLMNQWRIGSDEYRSCTKIKRKETKK